ncbi:SDR family oxidoreductase [Gordonia jinhuaensis]|uniref:Short-chain dehydrogenase n=1 Tax=Gordonia jinhuaensis TaxID=1517702 RepID=A0A916TD26_9ACTN|nr:SDR family oxidoreductase [Gordonia jinhuaensis]GGB40410.1 short-chain dehydrogenase [Gordonia jinhuaensis]
MLPSDRAGRPIAVAAGRWAVVTGASAGLGAEFAHRLAARGHHLVLVARRRDRLDALATQLHNDFGVDTLVVPADLTDPASTDLIVTALQDNGIHADVLINSAGFGTARLLVDEDPERVRDEIAVNVTALTSLTIALLGDLYAAEHGVLVNISSTASHQPIPSMAVYAATKAYVSALTEALWQESRASALTVVNLCPGPTETEFFAAAGSDRFRVGHVYTAREVVDAAMSAIDAGTRGPTLTIGVPNRLTALAARLLPRRLGLAVTARVVGLGAATHRPAAAAAGASPLSAVASLKAAGPHNADPHNGGPVNADPDNAVPSEKVNAS